MVKRYKWYVEKIFETGILTGGEYTEKAEKELSRLTGMKYVVLTNSCTSALEIIASYYRAKGYDTAYIQALGFGSTYLVFKKLGYRIRFIDVHETAYFIDPDKIPNRDEKAVVVVTDLFGYSYPELNKELDEKGIPVIRDSAQALGVAWNNNDYAVSFHAIKIVTSGEGGAVFTNNEELYMYAEAARELGIIGRRHMTYGGSYMMSELEAALLLVQLDYFDYIKNRLRENVERYDKLIPTMYDNILEDKGIKYRHNGIQAVLITENRDQWSIRGQLLDHYGIQTYGTSAKDLANEPIVAGEDRTETPIAEKKYREHVILPNYVELSDIEIQYVSEAVKQILANKKLPRSEWVPWK